MNESDTGYFFDQSDNVSKLLNELETWRGTPFLKGSRQRAKKGAAANCVSFVEAVLVNVGAIKPILWPPYVVVGGGEDMKELMLQTLRDIPEMEELPAPLADEMKPGDLIVSSGKEGNHLCILTVPPTVWHCITQYNVTEGNMFDPLIWDNRIAIFRVRKML